MKVELVKRLEHDHRLIDNVAGSLLAWLAEVTIGDGEKSDLFGYIEFFSFYVSGAHHRAEEVLFTTLSDRAEVPPRRGPLPVLRQEHVSIAQKLESIAELANQADQDKTLYLEIRSLVSLVWQHLDKESSVLLPESSNRLQRHGVSILASPSINEQEKTAWQVAEALVSRYRPIEDLEILRGDGCIACSAFGDRCHGIESEWWTSWEWAHHRSLDEG